MKIELSDSGEIIIDISEMAAYAKSSVRRLIDFDICRFCPEPTERADVLSCKMSLGGENFLIKGTSEGALEYGGVKSVIKTKRIKKVYPGLSPASSPAFLAEGCLAAFLLAKENGLDSVGLILSFEDEKGGSAAFFKTMETSYLARIAEGLLERCAPFAAAIKEYKAQGKTSIANMPFPHTSVREGQKDLINEVYRCIKKNERLLAVAPTGIGKTVSVLYPAVKALGAGLCDKVFYLTAKTVTGKNALDAVRRMNAFVPGLRAILIVAKERCCPAKDKKNTFTVDKCDYLCPRLSDNMDGEYKERCRAALRELLKSGAVYDKDDIKSVAEKYFLCPYELSLDLSEYCQIVVCDYNYVFDTRVRFRRYFCSENMTDKYVFLIDEAHNLPDRAREMYYGSLRLSDVEKVGEKLREAKFFDATVFERLGAVRSVLEETKERCLKEAEITERGGYGYFTDSEIPKGAVKAFTELQRALVAASENIDDPDLAAELEKLSDSLSDVIHVSAFFDDKFTLFAESYGNDMRLRLMCLDPSDILGGIMSGAVSTVLFSATLTPTDYFADISGCKDARILELDSPYSPDNFCIAAVDTVSTKYVSRGDTAKNIAEIILHTVEAKKGNYMVYFPSYEYMDTVVKAFLRIAPKNINAAAQKSGMSVDARRKFLSFFESGKGENSLVGFCVLGGVFSEGIDLPDEMLIGAILVGIGLPGLSSELNILRDYYERTREDGYRFAYVYPGMIKILQAAGRVIRSETDRGVVVLIDDRYADPEIQKLLPPHWSNLRYIGNTYSLSKYLKEFWGEEKN